MMCFARRPEHISAYKNPGLVNLDFADVTAVMKDAGYAHMGVARAEGKDKAEEAAKTAISSPLLETTIDGARGVIINITSSPDIDLEDVELASTMISRAAHPDANIIWGAAFDENLDDELLRYGHCHRIFNRRFIQSPKFRLDPAKRRICSGIHNRR